MARPKRPSDERYNARRRARRAAQRAQKAGNYEEASRLLEQVSASYVKPRPILQNTSKQPAAPKVPKASKAPKAQKQPRAKRASDEIYNARRRLRRQAAKIEREAQRQQGTERDLALGFARYLRQQAEATGKKLSQEQQVAAFGRLQRIRESTKGAAYGRSAVARRNAIMMQQLNAAGTKGADSSISERKKDVFWAATKGLWPTGADVKRNDRYDKILSHFYTDNTSDAIAFRKWLEEKKGTTAQDSFGDLQLVYEYVTEELNDPAVYDAPDVPYQQAMNVIKMAK